MNLVMVDDEPLANARLSRLLSLQGFAPEQIHAFTQTSLAWPFLQQQPVSLLFLDVDMPEEDGLSLAARVRQQPWGASLPLVFVTAHPEHALSAFRVRAQDYLLKPIVAQDFALALQRLLPGPWLLVQQAGVSWRLPWADIQFLQAEDKLTRVQSGGREFWLNDSLKQLQTQMPPGWLRVHRSYLVNMAGVQGVAAQHGEHWLLLAQGQKLPISRRLLADVKAYWQAFAAE